MIGVLDTQHFRHDVWKRNVMLSSFFPLFVSKRLFPHFEFSGDGRVNEYMLSVYLKTYMARI